MIGLAGKDLTGCKFGKLTVIQLAEPIISKSGTKRKRWICRCDCGNETIVLDQNLKNGTAKSCGCINKPNLIGQRFGRLTVIERASNSNADKARWKCLCDCGGYTIATTSSLRNGNTNSCGCFRRDRINEYWDENGTDLVGQRFGKLTVIKKSETRGRHKEVKWVCRCDCGNETLVPANNLKSGGTQSCGCIRHKNILRERFGRLTVIKNGEHNGSWICQCDCGNIKEIYGNQLISGRIKSCGCQSYETQIRKSDYGERIYGVWRDMKQRCYNPNNRSFKHYGGRGIGICHEWLDDFMSFYNWAVNNGYKEGLTIDRRDNDGNYEPSNCRWVTQQIQVNNTRRNRYLEIDGQIKTVTEWARIKGVKPETVFGRIRIGVPVDHLFDPPHQTSK